MAKVTIERTGTDSYERIGLTVKVDGVTVGDGSIGGEPEDNCEARDYRWVRPMIRNLAAALGEAPPMTLGERPAVSRG